MSDDKMKIGDEVAFHWEDGRPDTVVVITHIGYDGLIDGMDAKGTLYASKNPQKWTKTGRYFPLVIQLLRQMSGEKLPSAQPQPQWIPCSERVPDEDHHIVNGIYRSDIVFVTVVNHDADDDTFTDMALSRDCKWQLYHFNDGDADIPEWCEVTAWMPLPEPYREGES